MAVTVQQAAVDALVAYLTTQLDGVTVSGEWPASEAELPELAVTVLMAGRRQDQHADATVVAVEGAGTTRVFVWRVKTATQGLQLDVWGRYPATRDDILAQLDEALNKGPLYTLTDGSFDLVAGEPTRDGVLLALAPASGHEGYVDFTFDGPTLGDSSERSIRNDYRATITGEAAMVLAVRTSNPVLQIAGLRLRVGEVPAEMTTENIDIVPSGEE
ncbi:MAG TPA: hypothetical protein VF382_04330 [Actinomycetota bacterium]